MKCWEYPDDQYSAVCIQPECANNRVACSEYCISTHYAHQKIKLGKAMNNVKVKIEVDSRILDLVDSINGFYSQLYDVLLLLRNSEIDRELKLFIKPYGFEVKDYKKISETVIYSQGTLSKLMPSFKRYMFFKKDQTSTKSNYELFLEDVYIFVDKRLYDLEREIQKILISSRQ